MFSHDLGAQFGVERRKIGAEGIPGRMLGGALVVQPFALQYLKVFRHLADFSHQQRIGSCLGLSQPQSFSMVGQQTIAGLLSDCGQGRPRRTKNFQIGGRHLSLSQSLQQGRDIGSVDVHGKTQAMRSNVLKSTKKLSLRRNARLSLIVSGREHNWRLVYALKPTNDKVSADAETPN